ncbi:alanine racemase [Corynebacterium bovis]|uniref:alanine racemase n=1 Tax=Corynebacterium bovis TaxID=36808 RepID=UPI00313A08B0
MTPPPTDVRTAVAGLAPPFAVLDLDAARANARELVRRAHGVPVRLASKSLRIRPLIADILRTDGVRGVLAYTLAEALWLVETGTADDVLVAYPTTDRDALRRLLADDRLRRAVTLTVDSDDHLDLVDAVRDTAGDAAGAEVRVCLDVDASLVVGPVRIGALRSPVRTPEEAAGLARRVGDRGGDRVVGLLLYEGQVAGTADTSAAVRAMKAVSTREIAARRARVTAAVGEALAVAGRPPLEFVNGGGTGSVETTAAESAVTEIGAGSGVVGPALFDHYRAFAPRPAEWFVVPVVRRPAADVVTVAGGGRIASGPPGTDRVPVVDHPEGLRLTRLEGAGEVQTPLRGAAARRLRLGDGVWFRHAKAGEQAEHTDRVVVVSGGDIIDHWPTYRGEGMTFL